jgi:hypothetical protein
MLKTYIFHLINFFLCLSITIFITTLINNRLLLEEYNIDEYTNNYCNKNSSSLSCKNKYKKRKFILLISDGTSYDELPYIYNPKEHNLTASFKFYDSDYKITGGNFESQFTGKFSRNYFYHKIKSDNFFKQLHNNGYKLSYLGVDYPVFLYLGGEKNIEFSKYKIEEKEENITFQNLCNLTYNIYNEEIKNYFKSISDKYLNTEKSRDEIFKFLDDYFINKNEDIINKLNLTECFINQFDYNPNNKSEKFGIIYYTTTLDDIHHLYSKKNYESIINSYVTNKFICKIHNWINLNPDFSLIIISDHGGNIFPGDETLNMHGSNINGNEGIFSLYNKDLGDNYYKLKYDNIKIINKYDYSSTMPQIIESINIPLNSFGKPLLVGNDNIIRFSAVKSKEEQVISYLKFAGIKFKEFKFYFDNLIYDIKNEQINNLNLFNDDYYEKRVKQLIDIHVKAEKLIHGKINFFHFVLFIFSFIIYFFFGFLFQFLFVKNIFRDDNIKDNYFKKFIILIFIYFIPNLLLFFLSSFFHICNRLRFGYFFQCAFIFCFFIYEKRDFDYNKFLKYFILIFGFVLFVFYDSYYYIKMFFSYYGHILFSIFIFYPFFFFFVCYEINNKLDLVFFDKNNKYSCKKILLYLSSLFLIILFIFDVKRINNTGSDILTTIIGFFFIILIFINHLIIIYGKGKLINYNPLSNLITFFICIYLLSESEKLILIFVLPFTELILKRVENKKYMIDKILYYIILIFFYDSLNLYTRYKLTNKVNPPLKYRNFNFGFFNLFNFIINGVTYNIFYIILASFIHSTSKFKKNNNKYDDSIIIRSLVYFKFIFIFIYCFYNIFIQKNQNEFMYIYHLCQMGIHFSIFDVLWNFGYKIIELLKIYLLKIKVEYEDLSSQKKII